ncbi:MAG: hypothetical protein COA71_13160 [SAR86 cluster bacterium]|uniref:DUF1330 domain-containing protein n=1 Tax=SAR86 cluster bacterium TaxID=2030880 RepID=A0A2A5C8M7_9GAMM|nr:DUF1330 domain-containing protein [Gammaproteobacteria bacterium AH-315-E17]PCJ39828.1 MAG: hypothetical protein COA71_13160 [SAR86 cluster bacterium]
MSDKDKPVYLVANLAVKDLEDFIQRYGAGVMPQLQKAGAEILAAAQPQLLEGNQGINRTVLIRFPNADIANNWYSSEEYQPLKNLRINELTTSGSAVFVEAFDPDAT